MSINMDMEQSADYSDFRYQQFAYEHRDNGPTAEPGNFNSRASVEFDVLGEIGGLDTNEVAELCYHEIYAQLEFEDEENDQDIATFVEARGAFGVDLTESDEPGNPDQQDQGSVGTVFGLSDPASVNVAVGSSVRDEVLQTFRTTGSAPHDDVDGPGGNAFTDNFYATKNWRALTGRGPVLDSADNLSIVSSLIAGNINIPFELRLRGHLVWDVAEVDEAGRRFSIPSM